MSTTTDANSPPDTLDLPGVAAPAADAGEAAGAARPTGSTTGDPRIPSSGRRPASGSPGAT